MKTKQIIFNVLGTLLLAFSFIIRPGLSFMFFGEPEPPKSY